MARTNAMQNGRKAQLPGPLNRVTSFNWGGDKEFVTETKAKLGAKAGGRRALEICNPRFPEVTVKKSNSSC